MCPFVLPSIPFFLLVSLKFLLVLKSFNSVSWLFNGYLKFKESLKDVSWLFAENFKEVSRVFKGSFWEISRVFQEAFEGVSR